LHALSYLKQHPDVGAVSPRITGPDGELQYLCRRSPTLWRLFLRGFAPTWLKHRFQYELDRYEMKAEISAGTVLIDPPVISGCFMLFRTSLLRQLSGFDSRFFLYFEDYDLSIRARRVTHLAYLPQVRIMHRGGHAARKGVRHTLLFVRSAALFFRIHGWRLC
jgi:GT2 family glycosyltransferase